MTMRYSHATANMARSAAQQVEALLVETDNKVGDKIGTTASDEEQETPQIRAAPQIRAVLLFEVGRHALRPP
jgi:hypothetical protein